MARWWCQLQVYGRDEVGASVCEEVTAEKQDAREAQDDDTNKGFWEKATKKISGRGGI